MSKTIIYLKHSSLNEGNPVQVMCTSVIVANNKKNDKTANANYDQYPADVQSLGRENTKYTLQNAKIDKGDLTYDIYLGLVSMEHDDDNPLLLNVKYNDKQLVDSLGSDTDIPVTFDGTSTVTFSTIDSKDASVPYVNLPFVEVYNG